MEKILEKARELGQLIAESKEFKNLNEEEQNASSNAELSDLIAKYTDLRDKIAAMELEGDENEEALDKLENEADKLQSQITNHQSMLSVNLARLNFNRMMERVNRALQAKLTGEDEFAAENGCASGGCAGCSGCGSPR